MPQPAPRHRRITSAHVIALIALFVSLGGGAYAVTTAPNNSVTSASVKDNSLIGKDVKNGSLTGLDVKDNSLTGADVKESTLGQVPSAAQAGNAATAGNATTLQGKLPKDFARASNFGGANFSLHDDVANGVPTKLVIDQPGGFLKITASCDRGGVASTQMLGAITITSSSNLWSVSSSFNNLNATRLPPGQAESLVQAGFSQHDQLKTAYWAAHAGNLITGLAAVEINPTTDGSHECRFGYTRFGL